MLAGQRVASFFVEKQQFHHNFLQFFIRNWFELEFWLFNGLEGMTEEVNYVLIDRSLESL